VRIPAELRKGLREKLWALADGLGWQYLTWVEKSPQYDAWTKDPEVGGLLARHMDQRQIRVYIKDTIMKGYVRSRQSDPRRPFKLLGLDGQQAVEDYERPHGRRLDDGRVVAWGNADDWKLVLMAVHERAYLVDDAIPYAAVLMHAVGRYQDDSARRLVQDAADKLLIRRVIWL
jgi:hypothetical protein